MRYQSRQIGSASDELALPIKRVNKICRVRSFTCEEIINFPGVVEMRRNRQMTEVPDVAQVGL